MALEQFALLRVFGASGERPEAGGAVAFALRGGHQRDGEPLTVRGGLAIGALVGFRRKQRWFRLYGLVERVKVRRAGGLRVALSQRGPRHHTDPIPLRSATRQESPNVHG